APAPPPLFGVIGSNSKVMNITVSGEVDGANTDKVYSGGIAGDNRKGLITNCTNIGIVTAAG
ncbi:MAG: hypothetical protein LUG14_09130, partial [Synergistaceae bacterium]|nr:hypothetical protein [Synergistaceae bacterium]